MIFVFPSVMMFIEPRSIYIGFLLLILVEEDKGIIPPVRLNDEVKQEQSKVFYSSYHTKTVDGI